MAAPDLVSIDEARAFLKSGASDDGVLARLVTAASSWAETLTKRPLRYQAVTNLRFTGPRGTKIFPVLFPIDPAKAVTLKLDDVTQTIWRVEADGLQTNFDVALASNNPAESRVGLNHIYRRSGWLPDTINAVLLGYTGGYGPVPEDLKQAVLYLVQKLWRDQEKQMSDLTAISSPAGGSVALIEKDVPGQALRLLEPYMRLVY